MRGQWIANSSARLETFSRSRLAEASGGWPDSGAGVRLWLFDIAPCSVPGFDSLLICFGAKTISAGVRPGNRFC